MRRYIHSCDDIRQETIDSLKCMGPGLDSVVARGKYFARVDDKKTTNNFCDLVKDATRGCERMINGKLWIPIHSQTNLEKLLDELSIKWPRRAEENYRHIEGIFNEIDETFEKKGLKSAKVPGVKQYEPSNKSPVKQSKPKTTDGFQTADEDDNPIFKDERLKNIDRKIIERILNEVVHKKQEIKWDDIAGLNNVKQAINEIVVYPMQNPDLFQGLLAPAKGLLLFGPPGTGKTLIGKCIAAESGASFFAISASSLTSKWIGEGEKMVRALFGVARCMQPSVVFIDEIDSLLTQRVDGEHDSTRRMKTEFLVQFDGVSTGKEDRLLIVGATNRPQELDEAARRRFTKRLYIPLPEKSARKQLIQRLMLQAKSALTEECIDKLAEKSEGYSGADMATLCQEAALVSVRDVIRAGGNAKNISREDLPPISLANFESAFKIVKASVGSCDLGIYEDWDKKYGASRDFAC